MLKVLAILIVVLAATANGFSNLIYSRHLLDEFYHFNNVVSVSRHRRDVDDDEDIDLCCTGDIYDAEDIKKVAAIENKCYTQLNVSITAYSNPQNCAEVAKNYQIEVCKAECMFQALNLIDENGKIDRAAMIKYYEEHEVRDIEWKKAVFKKYLDDCLTEATAKEKLNDRQCSDVPLNYSFCFLIKTITGCPPELRIDSEMCRMISKIPSTSV